MISRFTDHVEDSEAYYTLGQMAEAGEGTEFCIKRARSDYKRAAKMGHPGALSRLRQLSEGVAAP